MRKHWKFFLGLFVVAALAVGIAWPTLVSVHRDTENALTNELKGAGYTSVLTQNYAHGNGQYSVWENTSCPATTNGLVTVGTNYSACANNTVLTQMTIQAPGFVVCMSDGDPKKIMDILALKPKDANNDLYYAQVDATNYDSGYLNDMPSVVQLLKVNQDKTSSVALGTSSTDLQIGVVAPGDLQALVTSQCDSGN